MPGVQGEDCGYAPLDLETEVVQGNWYRLGRGYGARVMLAMTREVHDTLGFPLGCMSKGWELFAKESADHRKTKHELAKTQKEYEALVAKTERAGFIARLRYLFGLVRGF